MTRVLAPTPENLRDAALSLLRGEIGAIPTETVYGLAADALNPVALARVFEAKERPLFDPLIVHVAPGLLPGGIHGVVDLEAIELVDATSLSATARARADALIQRFWPGPLTLVLPRAARVPDLVTSGLGSVGVRMPKHPVTQALIAQAERALAAPSANRFGRISPTTATAVAEELTGKIPWILDGGPCQVGVESTVVSIAADGEVTLLRPGGVPAEEVSAAIGAPLKAQTAISGPAPAPGLLESHYAPAKPVFILPAPLAELDAAAWQAWWKALPRAEGLTSLFARPSLLVAQGDPRHATERFAAWGLPLAQCRSLSVAGDSREAAQRLFALLRELDSLEGTPILVEPYPGERGLGHAIADRLRRAAARRTESRA